MTIRSYSKRVAALAVLTTSSLILAACGTSSGADNASGEVNENGTLNIYAPDPSIEPRQQHGPLGRAIADSLLDRDPETQEFVPWLAESWEINDESTEFTFHLKEGVTFSNGEAFNAEAVKANFDGAIQDLDDGGGWYVRGIFDDYIETEVVDEYTATVKFSKGNVPFLATLATSQLAIIAPSEFEKTLDERKLNGIIGTGPFVLESVTPNESITLARRDDYAWGSDLWENKGAPKLEEVQVSIVPEIGVREGALQAGEADFIVTPSSDGATQLIAQNYNVDYRSQVGIGFSIEVNFNSEFGGDLDVRRAIQKAVDRTEVTELAAGELSPPASSVITSSTFGHKDFSDTILKHDPEGAESILEEAGWVAGSDGIREKDGKRLSISLITWPRYEDDVALIKQQLEKVGIEVVLDFDEKAPTVFTDEGKYDFHYRNTTRADADVLRKVYANAAYEGDPVILYQDNATVTEPGSNLEEILQAQAIEGDEDARIELLAQAQEIILRDALRIPIIDNASYIVASAPYVQGVSHNSLSEPVLSQITVSK